MPHPHFSTANRPLANAPFIQPWKLQLKYFQRMRMFELKLCNFPCFISFRFTWNSFLLSFHGHTPYSSQPCFHFLDFCYGCSSPCCSWSCLAAASIKRLPLIHLPSSGWFSIFGFGFWPAMNRRDKSTVKHILVFHDFYKRNPYLIKECL